MKKNCISTRGIIATSGLLLVMSASGLALSTQLFTNHTNARAAIVESPVQGAVDVRLNKRGQVKLRGILVYAGHPNTPLLIQLNANSCDGSALYSQSQTTDAQAKILLNGGSTSTGTMPIPTPTTTSTGNTGTTGTGTTGTNGTGTTTTPTPPTTRSSVQRPAKRKEMC